eukprot:TRINITY_DN1660_c0_g1_i9.p2 TRINITY_DN1660_c0_g1~~TRINITY_DN1660_c0_g1_i9.p2  ORF type:complete len:117 (-),score=13.91 TRINITY_DN1660_c0_g1_i9:187-537(-)
MGVFFATCVCVLAVFGIIRQLPHSRFERSFGAAGQGQVEGESKKNVKLGGRRSHLGHVVSNEGVRPSKEMVAVIEKMKAPRTVKEVERLLGTASYYRRFIESFGEIAEAGREMDLK